MRAVVGVTDNAWAAYLRDRPHITEANFWMPSARTFRALAVGEPFLFKTHWPNNRLVGGGFFSGFAELTVAEAWEIHGESNGVSSLAELTQTIASYRKVQPDPSLPIGCILLRDLFFDETGSGLPGPADFAKNIVSYKGYDFTNESPIEADLRRLLEISTLRLDEGETLLVPGPTKGLPTLTVPRVGQDAFKSLVLSSYERRCAITGSRVKPVLQAAHIRPVSDQGEHRVDNGMLLRSDVHILFDRGYLGVDPRHRLQVSPRLRMDFGNGEEFYAKAGTEIGVPRRRADRPNRDAVTWHLDTRFLR